MEKTVMSCVMCTAHKYYWGDKIKKKDKGGECSRYRKTEEVPTEFRWVCLRARGHLEELVVDRKLILTWIFKKLDGRMDWIDVAQSGGRRRSVVNAVHDVSLGHVGRNIVKCNKMYLRFTAFVYLVAYVKFVKSKRSPRMTRVL
jgi:hypothetical protein